MPTLRFPAKSSLDDIRRAGLGIVSWNNDPAATAASSVALVSGTIYGLAVPYRAGQVVTNLGFGVAVAAAGTTPTGIFVGIANATTVVMDSANLATSSAWTSTGMRSVALSSAYTVPSDGVYYHLILLNGSFGTTQMTLYRSSGLTGVSFAGGSFIYCTGGTGQTALPSVSSAITLASTGSPINFTTYST